MELSRAELWCGHPSLKELRGAKLTQSVQLVWVTIATHFATIPNYNRGSLAKLESRRTSNTITQLQPPSIPPNPKSAALLTDARPDCEEGHLLTKAGFQLPLESLLFFNTVILVSQTYYY